ncbi:hypothetical protein [Streptomyces sp. B6B3]|uniref:hypothetical protein n=1 Tax=Streptomyces sp. B6B3 TaxID=3153570 RepID=UPI00325C798F
MSRPIRRHRFEPARLVLGLALIQIAVLYLVRVAGRDAPPLPVLIVLTPVALVLAGAVAMLTHSVRRRGRQGSKPD